MSRSAGSTLLDLQNRALQLAIEDHPLQVALEELMRAVEGQSSSGVIGSVLLFDEASRTLRHGAAPSLPLEYNQAIDGISVGVGIGSCGTAAATNRPVYVSDIATDPLWADFKDLALAHDLRACWSTPFRSREGKVLGTFAMYYRQPREPTATDLETVDLITRTAALIVERNRATRALAESEERLRLATDAAEIGFWDVDVIAEVLVWPPLVKAMFGISKEVPVTMQDFYDGLHPDDRARTTAAYLAAADPNQRALYDVEYRTVGKEDGMVRWVAAKGRGVFDAQGRCLRVIGTAIDITHRKGTELQLKELNETLEIQVVKRTAERNRLWNMTNLLMAVAAFDSTIREVNPAWATLLGWSPLDLVGKSFAEFVHPDEVQASLDWTARLAAGEVMGEPENRYRCKDGSYRSIAWSIERGEGVFHCVGRDVTIEKAQAATLAKVEEALRQSQKMEAVGQLTGGLAHDFNNMLAVVVGSLDLLTRRIGPADARAKRYANAAMEGAKRASNLTQRLLAFSRQQPLEPEVLDANKLVAGMSDLLNHTLSGEIRLETVLAAGLWKIHADPNQLENVILNLAINARDAMPDGGRLTIETQNSHLDERYSASHLGVPAGQYVLIAMTDTGGGMSPEIIQKAFDPFFTTKGVGKGTGLGLSQVYGFVKQSGGHVKIYSEMGKGTTLKVYLPRRMGHALETADELEPASMLTGESKELVLVVDDESAVREFSVDALSELGYSVIEADGAASALRALRENPSIALMFTDVVMPDMNGAKLSNAARELRSDLKILFTTGYTRNAIVHNGVLDPGVALIGKPFTLEELAAKVRDVLDTPLPFA